MKERNKIVFLEGCPSCGKSYIANAMREQYTEMTMLSLTGLKDNSYEGKIKHHKYHMSFLDMLYQQRIGDMSFVFARSFLSEQVYASLGFKSYSFDDSFDILLKHLDMIGNYYDIYFILLEVDEEQIKQRIDRDKHEYHKYSVEDSLMQQREYKRQMKHIAENTDNVKCLTVPSGEGTLETIDKILKNMIGD